MDFERARYNMVEQQIRPWDVLDFRLLDVLQELPREEFVSEDQKSYAYADMNLPLPNRSVMLEPKIIARMIQALNLTPLDRVLEIGTGSGYASAIMAKMSDHVDTIDIDGKQAEKAHETLKKLGIENVSCKVHDGFDASTYNPEDKYQAIYVGAAVSIIPNELCEMLSENGRMVVIVGTSPVQQAMLITRNSDGDFNHKVLFDTNVPTLIEGALSIKKDFFVF